MSADALALGLAFLPPGLAPFLRLRDDIALRGVAFAAGIFIIVVQTSGIEVGLDILREWFAVEPDHTFHEYGFTILKMGSLCCRERLAPQFRRDLELFPLLKAVRRAGVAQTSGFEVGSDERGEFLATACHHVGMRMVDRLTGKPIHLDISDLPMKAGVITNRNKFILGPSGSGKSFFTNHMVRQYFEQGTHVLLVDTGNSYQGLCNLINARTQGEDGIYLTYEEDNPISFNPFFVEDGVFDIEKKESIKTLILTLWKRDDEPPTRAEEVALSNAVNLFLEKIRSDRSIVPSFNTFYEFIRDEYQEILKMKRTREKDFDVFNFLNVLEPYYRGGEYDFLLNSDRQLDLLNKRFIVFELDNIKDNKVLFPVVTIIIMETFINKMRKLKGIRKMILLEEAWKAISKEGMAEYLKYLFKTVRKFFGEAVVVTQEVEDIISSPIVKGTIINNSDCKILLDQRKYLNKFDEIQDLLGLTDKERAQILSINMANHHSRKYKEVWIGLGGSQSAVYATEVSLEEYVCYTTEETEKLELTRLTEKLGGNIELAIRQLAERKRNSNP